MQVSDKLSGLYEGYYASNSPLFLKRTIAAKQTVAHITELLPGGPYESVLDIGAGEGSVLDALSRSKFAKELHAVEISESGINAIVSRNIPHLKSVNRFDGYTIEAANSTFAMGTAIHVLEHVEHERAFIEEISRVCELIYIEVPLELTLRVDKAIRESGVYGHINFYNASTFINLLNSSGLEVIDFKVFANSKEYEVHLGGKVKGAIKHGLRSGLLKLAPSVAGLAMSYLGAAVCRRRG